MLLVSGPMFFPERNLPTRRWGLPTRGSAYWGVYRPQNPGTHPSGMLSLLKLSLPRNCEFHVDHYIQINFI